MKPVYKIVAFGLLPKNLGGKNHSGIGLAIFHLHDFQNSENSQIRVILAANDFNQKKRIINSTLVYGLSLKIIFFFIVSNPLIFIKVFWRALLNRKKHRINFKSFFLNLIFFEYIFKKEKPDAVQLHGADTAIALNYSPNFHKTKKLLRIHGLDGLIEYGDYEKRRHFLENEMSKVKVDLLTALSSDIAEKWKINYHKHTYPIYTVLNGYDDSVFFLREKNVKNDEKINLITISAITENKGQLRVIEALSKLENSSFFRYTIIGSGYNTIINEMKSISEKHDLDVTFIPFVPQNQLPEYIINADFMILPSKREGFGMGFIESIACGTPVIIPENLPLAKEHGVISTDNAVFLKSYQTEHIIETLYNIRNYSFDREKVSNSVKDLTWKRSANEYNRILMDFVFSNV